jgi:hypothetical protein
VRVSRLDDAEIEATLGAALADRDARLSELIGTSVQGSDGEDLGEIEDFIATPGRDAQPIVVLSVGGVFDLGDKWYSASLDKLRVNRDGDGLVLDATQAEVAAAPDFDYRPRIGERSVQAGVAGPSTVNSVGRLLGATLVDETDQSLGEIEDFVITTGSAGLRAVVTSGGIAGVDERRATIPFEELHIDVTGEEAGGIVQQPKVRVDFDDTVLAARPAYEYPESLLD